MKSKLCLQLILTGITAAALSAVQAAESLDAAMQAKVDAAVKQIQGWASDPVLVKAVKAHNASLPAASAAMAQDKWQALTVLDPFVREFSKNEAGQFLKGKKGDLMSEAFLSGADGLKVAFLSKPSNWSHKGKPKHDVPMTGKNWQGPVEVDDSTGLQQVQVGLPVMDEGKAIGSLVVGISINQLSK
jgi:hypothetical protein